LLPEALITYWRTLITWRDTQRTSRPGSRPCVPRPRPARRPNVDTAGANCHRARRPRRHPEDESARYARAGAWAAASALPWSGALTTWAEATAAGARFPIFPAYVFVMMTLAALYMCFAELHHWWPTNRRRRHPWPAQGACLHLPENLTQTPHRTRTGAQRAVWSLCALTIRSPPQLTSQTALRAGRLRRSW